MFKLEHHIIHEHVQLLPYSRLVQGLQHDSGNQQTENQWVGSHKKAHLMLLVVESSHLQ